MPFRDAFAENQGKNTYDRFTLYTWGGQPMCGPTGSGALMPLLSCDGGNNLKIAKKTL